VMTAWTEYICFSSTRSISSSGAPKAAISLAEVRFNQLDGAKKPNDGSDL